MYNLYPLISIDIHVRVVNLFAPQRIAAAELFGQVGVVHKQDGEPKPWPQHRAHGICGRPVTPSKDTDPYGGNKRVWWDASLSTNWFVMVGDSNCTEQYAKDSQSQFRSSSQCLQAEHWEVWNHRPAWRSLRNMVSWLSKKTGYRFSHQCFTANKGNQVVQPCIISYCFRIGADTLPTIWLRSDLTCKPPFCGKNVQLLLLLNIHAPASHQQLLAVLARQCETWSLE